MTARQRSDVPVGGQPGAVGQFDVAHAIPIEVQLGRSHVQPKLDADRLKPRFERREKKRIEAAGGDNEFRGLGARQKTAAQGSHKDTGRHTRERTPQ